MAAQGHLVPISPQPSGEEMSEGALGFREASDPDALGYWGVCATCLPTGFVVCALSGTPPPTHMLLECHLLQQCPELLVICWHSAI